MDDLCRNGLHPRPLVGRCRPCRLKSNSRAVFNYEHTPKGRLSKSLRSLRRKQLERRATYAQLTGGHE